MNFLIDDVLNDQMFSCFQDMFKMITNPEFSQAAIAKM